MNKESILSAKPGGFTLATLLVISTTLMIMGAAILQGTLSVKNFLNDQYYNELAREAAEAGVRYAESCVAQSATWPELRPETNCSGVSTTSPSYVVETDTLRSYFTVGALDVRPDGSTIVKASGKVDLLRRESSAAYKTYNESMSQAVGASTMTVLPKSMDVGAVAFDDTMSYILGLDGQVYGMGSNGSGRLGDGTTTNRNTPTKFILPSGLYAKKVAANYHFAAVLASNGQVYTAGSNSHGQLGDGSTTNRSTPVRFRLPAGVNAMDVEVFGGGGPGYNTLVLGTNGRWYGSGSNVSGQLGGTNTANILTPKTVAMPSGVARFKELSGTRTTNNNSGVVLLSSDGRVYGLGDNSYAQLGSSNLADKTSYVQLALPSSIKAVDVDMGYYNVFVHTADNKIYGFGKGNAGQLGNGGTAATYSTAQEFNLPGTLTARKFMSSASSNVSATDGNNDSSNYVLASDHQVYGAGQNHKGQLGDNTLTNRSTPVRFQLPSGLTAQDLSTHYFTTCVLASDKNVYCTGENDWGQLGVGNLTDRRLPVKFPLPAGVLATSVTVGRGQVYVFGSDGNVYAAGRNADGELGVGDNTNRSTPTPIKMPKVPLDRTPMDASLSYIATRVIASDGQVYSYGRNSDGEIGDGTTGDPVTTAGRFQLPSGYAMAVKGGFYGTYVMSSNGQLYSSGRNQNNQLGVTSTANQLTPVKFPIDAISSDFTLRDFVVSTSEGNDTTVVRSSSNQVYSTGLNGSGQAGNASTSPIPTIDSNSRFRLPGGVTAMNVWFGDGGLNNVTFVLGTDERVYGAGRNNHGQLGDGHTTTPVTTPVTANLPGGCYTEDMDIGTDSSYHLCRNGDVYAWGRNNDGQLGLGDTSSRSSPAKITLPAGVIGTKLLIPRGASSPGAHAYVLASDGNVYGWGANNFGQLGDGTTTQRLSPVRFGLPSGVHAADAWLGHKALFVLGSNGSLYAAGANFSGQLGVGDTINRSTPTEVSLPGSASVTSVVSQYAYYSLSSSGTPDHFTGFFGSDGKLYMAGYNGHGQLGDGTTTQRNSPVELKLPQPAAPESILF